jgi:hypothetical protein
VRAEESQATGGDSFFWKKLLVIVRQPQDTVVYMGDGPRRGARGQPHMDAALRELVGRLGEAMEVPDATAGVPSSFAQLLRPHIHANRWLVGLVLASSILLPPIHLSHLSKPPYKLFDRHTNLNI